MGIIDLFCGLARVGIFDQGDEKNTTDNIAKRGPNQKVKKLRQREIFQSDDSREYFNSAGNYVMKLAQADSAGYKRDD